MINSNEFDPTQSAIIRMMCQIQLESLQRIHDNNDESGEDIRMLLIIDEIPEENFRTSIVKQMEKFKKLHQDPEDLKVLDAQDLSNFRHLLTNIEDVYNESYPQAISNLWNRLFLIEQTQSMASYSMLNIN